jgi:hypothetical protein
MMLNAPLRLQDLGITIKRIKHDLWLVLDEVTGWGHPARTAKEVAYMVESATAAQEETE